MRVLAGKDLVYETPTDGPVLTIENYHNPRSHVGSSTGFGSALDDIAPAPVIEDKGSKQLLFGTENGQAR